MVLVYIRSGSEKKVSIGKIRPTSGLSKPFILDLFLSENAHFPTHRAKMFFVDTKNLFLHLRFYELGNKIWNGCSSRQCAKKHNCPFSVFVFAPVKVEVAEKISKNRKTTP